MWTVHQKAQFVLRYAELKSVVAVQRKWRSLHPGEKPPTDRTLNRWMNQFKKQVLLKGKDLLADQSV